MRSKVCATVLIWNLCLAGACASSCFLTPSQDYINGIATVTGTIEAKRLNTIDILDEQDQRVKSFIDLGHKKDIKVGDRVRLYYYFDSRMVENIKRETPVEYQPNGQNAGYVFKSS